MNQKILSVNVGEACQTELGDLLRREGFELSTSGKGQDTMETISRGLFDVVLCNVSGFADGGLEMLRRCKRNCPETMFILIGAEASVEVAVQAMREGAFDYLTKVPRPEELSLLVARAVEQKKLLYENTRFREELGARYDFSQIIGTSSAIRSILERIKRIVNTKSTVLITGESGTGKELVAKAIHYNSSRRNHPMITINCGSIPHHLLESEFFGHVKGAFTGAISSKRGLFEEANHSTLFLDEIAEMDLDLQVKILRAIEDEEIRHVGDTQPIRLDLRIIAATNRDLAKAVEEGKFRKDLFYRLNIVTIHIPPLRERREDIPPLANFFLEMYRRKHNRNIQGFAAETLRQLMDCDWPGNVRELENAIEQAVVMTDEPWIKIKDISCLLPERNGGIRVSLPATDAKLKTTLRELQKIAERELIGRVIQECDGNRTQAAAKLGISRRALLYKLKAMKLNDQKV